MRYGITSRNRIREILKKGDVYRGISAKVHYLRSGSTDWHMAVSVPRKVGCAVVRNRIRRITREAFRLYFLKSCDLIIRVDTDKADFALLKEEAEHLNRHIDDKNNNPHTS